jgi:hypothetical protein
MAMVAICDRSPHSAKNVKVKACVKIAVDAALAAAARPLCPFSASSSDSIVERGKRPHVRKERGREEEREREKERWGGSAEL